MVKDLLMAATAVRRVEAALGTHHILSCLLQLLNASG